jgi:hypothetical protein
MGKNFIMAKVYVSEDFRALHKRVEVSSSKYLELLDKDYDCINDINM